MYKKKRWKLGSTMEIEEYHDARYGAPGIPRRKRAKPTPEQMAKQNRWNREKRVRRQLRMYFHKGDYFTTVTYTKTKRPADMEAAKKDLHKFLQKVRREYKRRGEELRWMANIEVGTKGAWHVHLVMNRIPDTDIIIADAWGHGKPISQPMREEGSFADLAYYMTKTPETEKRLKASHFSASRNMPLPDPEVTLYHRRTTFRDKDIKIPKGWYLDKESVREGVNPVTGYPYRSYALHRIEEGKKKRCIS